MISDLSWWCSSWCYRELRARIACLELCTSFLIMIIMLMFWNAVTEWELFCWWWSRMWWWWQWVFRSVIQNSHWASDFMKNVTNNADLCICIQNTAAVHESSSNWVKKTLTVRMNMSSAREMSAATSECWKATSDISSTTCSSLSSCQSTNSVSIDVKHLNSKI